MAFHLRLVKQYHRKLQLLQKSVRGYVHELHHEIVHLVDCLKHQKQHNQVCSLWTKNYGHSAAQNIALVRGVDQGTGAKEREVLLEGNQKFIRDLEKQVDNIMKSAEDLLNQIKRDELQNRRLEKYWNDENMACHSDTFRCGEKISMMLDSMKGIMAAFKEDRHRVVLGKLEENIHMVENQAVDTRNRCDKVNLKLGHLEKRQTEFVTKLDEFSKVMIGSMHEVVCEPNVTSQINQSSNNRRPTNLLNTLNNKLNAVEVDVIELKQSVDANFKILHSTEKQILENGI
uniref:TANK-binding kinase 1 coiled-coil domain-containing protein n=1 Tax=Magallana gigas TaxID=29159 RepID=K1PXF0_MAGGI